MMIKVRCERDKTKFTAEDKPYPSSGKQSTYNCSTGDRYIDCPMCRRRYFLYDDGSYQSDRKLTIL